MTHTIQILPNTLFLLLFCAWLFVAAGALGTWGALCLRGVCAASNDMAITSKQSCCMVLESFDGTSELVMFSDATPLVGSEV